MRAAKKTGGDYDKTIYKIVGLYYDFSGPVAGRRECELWCCIIQSHKKHFCVRNCILTRLWKLSSPWLSP